MSSMDDLQIGAGTPDFDKEFHKEAKPKTRSLEEALEKWKQLGVYALNLFYGGDVGLDDRDVPAEERKIQLLGVPMGCVAGCRILYQGRLMNFLKFDPTITRPHVIPQPDRESLARLSEGFYIWGADRNVAAALGFMYPPTMRTLKDKV